jgi:RsiW-degrading membrane proteinase PrsW (M82 family)
MSVLIGGIVAYLALLFVLVLTQDAALFPALLLVGALTVPLTVLLWASNGPRGELLPSGIILVTALVGGVVGILVAAICESIAAAVLGDSMLLLIGLIEETAKLIVPLIILAVAYPRTAQGGVVIGVAAGAGFAVLETMGYGFNALLGNGGGLGAVDATLLVRGVFAPAGHITWTGVLCAAIWFWRSGRRPGLGALATIGAYLGAIILHTVWDVAASIPLHVIVGLLSLAVLVRVVVAAHHAQGSDGAPQPADVPWTGAPPMGPYGQGPTLPPTIG